jgi:hypothetical protein
VPTIDSTRARGRPKRPGTDDFRLDQVAVLGLADIGGLDHHFLAAPVDRQQAQLAIGELMDDAERGAAALVDDLDDAGGIGRDRSDPCSGRSLPVPGR